MKGVMVVAVPKIGKVRDPYAQIEKRVLEQNRHRGCAFFGSPEPETRLVNLELRKNETSGQRGDLHQATRVLVRTRGDMKAALDMNECQEKKRIKPMVLGEREQMVGERPSVRLGHPAKFPLQEGRDHFL
jgi:hypothetical protein